MSIMMFNKHMMSIFLHFNVPEIPWPIRSKFQHYYQRAFQGHMQDAVFKESEPTRQGRRLRSCGLEITSLA